MIQVRKNCFETNSSSMHSLVVSKQIKPYTEEELALGYDGWYKERNKDFELWDFDEAKTYERSPFEVLRTPLDKLRYYCAAVLGTNPSGPKKTDIHRIKDFIMKQTGITDPKKIKLYAMEKNWRGHETKSYGAVYCNDSGETPMHYIKRNHISMEELILNPKYTIIVDGDETQAFKDLFRAGIINALNLEDISSGAAFWNDSTYQVHYCWIARDIKDKEYDPKNYVEDLFDYMDTYEIALDPTDPYDTKFAYKPTVIKDLLKLVKEKRPDIKTVFKFYTYNTEPITSDTIAKYNTSMFDEVIYERRGEEDD